MKGTMGYKLVPEPGKEKGLPVMRINSKLLHNTGINDWDIWPKMPCINKAIRTKVVVESGVT
jgi:hypothetical protein